MGSKKQAFPFISENITTRLCSLHNQNEQSTSLKEKKGNQPNSIFFIGTKRYDRNYLRKKKQFYNQVINERHKSNRDAGK